MAGFLYLGESMEKENPNISARESNIAKYLYDSLLISRITEKFRVVSINYDTIELETFTGKRYKLIVTEI